MSYQVGVDLGTTYSAAAVFRDGAATIFTLGTRSAAIPSVVLLRQDGTILTGDAAERRAMTEPERVVREFKRRVGDTTPIIVGGAPYSPEALTARLLESVVTDVQAREGGPPSRIVVTHPANWGNYKRDLLQQSVRLAGLAPESVGFLTEPEAAALSYAAQERIDSGEIVAVYDLGGGTFDAAVLRRTPDGFEVLGKPEGIERLGGIDFDAAVFAHVTSGLGNALAELDHEDPAALAAVARLRQDCVEAKEALSSDTDASVPVLLPNLQTEVRITRQEFESLIRPSLLDSIEAMKRAVRSASLEVSHVTRVLLVGGSSRIPLISLLVGSELGRPVAVDAHPKHAIAIGAAFAASGILDSSPDSPKPPVDVAARSGLDPNMTIVAPAHLYNPGTGSGTPLPVERPGPASVPPKALPVERPGPASVPPKA
ncbi:MAG: Hsp70 family protein, partial [Acidimicrobiia bacterium]|nr:Hsp70 family protein [Acidimicrobiia bacterium]